MTEREPAVEERERIRVGIAEYAVTDDEAAIATSGLGSCVGVALADREAGVRGLVHVMLPEENGDGSDRPGKYADTGVRRLVEEMADAGADPDRLTAQLAGGSQMLSLSQAVGERNVEAVREALADLDIPIESSDVGGDGGRSVVLDPDGELVVETAEDGA